MQSIGEGVYVALITPTDAQGILAWETLERLVRRVIDGGVAGIAVLGSTGESPSLTSETKRSAREAVARAAQGQVPVFTGVTACSTDQALREIEHAAQTGMDAALVSLPFYYPLTAGEMHAFYAALGERAALPIIIYNIPPFTKLSVPSEMVGALAEHPRIIGIKDSSRDFSYFQRVCAAVTTPDFKVFTGSDDLLLASLQAGGHGTICASANVVPALATGLVDAARNGQWNEAQRLQARIIRLVDAVRQAGGLRAWKAACELLGLVPAEPVLPLQPVPAADRSQLAAILQEEGVLPSASR